jgi:PGF-pre-PGF domain-containing protein
MKRCNIYLILLLVILSCITSASTADESGQWDLHEHDSIDMDHTIFALELDPPSINEPEDQVIEQGAAGEIIWKIKDKNPESYWVLRNDIQIVSPTSYKKSENIKVTIDTSTTGTWDYSIVASDESLNIASDHVEVEVIVDDTSAPVITNPTDVTIDQGDEGRSIVWTITESNPGMCWVHKNAEEFVSQRSYYDGEEITVQIDSSTAGIQTYSLFASDISGNEASDEVDVTVTITSSDIIAPAITNPTDVTIDQGDEDRNIVWTITELNPDMYRVYKNDEEFVSQRSYYDGEEITVQIDSSTAGIQTYSLFASDISGNEASDEVDVTVTITSSDIIAPAITNPTDVTIDQGDEDRNIVWTITELNPDMCRVHKNGEEFVSPRSYHDGDEITVQIDTSATGTQTYSLFASDISGNEASDEVDVTVTITSSDIIAPAITNPTDVTIDQGDEDRNIVWTITELNPDMCRVHKNGEEFVSPRSYHDGDEITVLIDTSATGIQTYSLFASDTSTNEASDQVEITVVFSDVDGPIITNPPDVTVDQGDEDRNIVWTITESNPGMCWVHKNGEELVAPRSYYDGDEITVPINTLTTGTQTYSIYVSDTSANEASDHVKVIISDTVAPVIDLTSFEKIKIGTSGNITWIINETNPDKYWILQNNDEIVSPRTYQNDCCINVPIKPTELGTLSYTIFANDISGNTASNQINITVQETAPLTITYPPCPPYDFSTTSFSIYINGTAEGIGSIPEVTITANKKTETAELELGDGYCVSFSHKIPLSYGTNTITVIADYGNDTTDPLTLSIIRKKEYNKKQTSGSSGGGSTSEDFHNILLKEIQREFVARDEQVCYHFVSEGNIISMINFTGMRTSGIIPARVEMLNNTSSLVNYAPLDMVYKNLNIWVGNLGWANPENIANATVDFKIEKLWVIRNNINESSIRMNRYEDGKWNILVTSLIGQDTQYLYFKSEIPGFSNFVVTGKQEYIGNPGDEGIDDNKRADVINEKPMNTTTEEDTGIPGFNVIANLFILLIVVQLLRKKKG